MKEKRPFGVCLWLMLLTCIVSCGSLYLYAWNTQVVAYPYWVDTLTRVRWYLVAIVATTLICAIIVRVVMMNTIQKARYEEKKKNVKSKKERETSESKKRKPEVVSESDEESDEDYGEEWSAPNRVPAPQSKMAPEIVQPKQHQENTRTYQAPHAYDSESIPNSQYEQPRSSRTVPYDYMREAEPVVPNRTVRPVAPSKPQMQPQPHFRPKTTDVNVEQEVSSDELLAILNKVDEHHRQQQKPSVPEPLYSSEPYAEPINEDDQYYNGNETEQQVPVGEDDYQNVEPQTDEGLAPPESMADNEPVQSDKNPLDALDEILGEEQFDKSKFTEQEIAFLNRMDDILNRAGINGADFSLGECVYGRISLFVKEIPNRYGKVERVWQVTDANGKLVKSDTRITEAGKAFAKIFKNG